jgi:hypothetical protein
MRVFRTVLFCLVFLVCSNTVKPWEGPRRQEIRTSARVLIPTAANNRGLFGAVFQTNVSIVNVTSRSYTINATLYRSGGGTVVRQIDMGSRQALNFDNFLQDVFSYSGPGGIELDALLTPPGGDALNQFAVFAEVYTDTVNGRYKTVVNPVDPLDGLPMIGSAITPAISVDGSSRTNIGCLNIATTQAIVNVDLYSSTGSLLTTYFVTAPISGWAQTAILQSVSGGYLVWRLQSGLSPYCFAVVVDNTSNDGSMIQPSQLQN